MTMRPLTRAATCVLLLATALLGGCHESELEPKTPDQMWEVERPGAATEAAYTMAPVPAVFDPAPVPRERPQSVSLGYIGDAPLTPAPHVAARWPWVPEPFHYRGGFGGYGYYGRGSRGGAMSSYAAPRHRR
jgi:hypothetical protein